MLARPRAHLCQELEAFPLLDNALLAAILHSGRHLRIRERSNRLLQARNHLNSIHKDVVGFTGHWQCLSTGEAQAQELKVHLHFGVFACLIDLLDVSEVQALHLQGRSVESIL